MKRGEEAQILQSPERDLSDRQIYLKKGLQRATCNFMMDVEEKKH